MRNAYVTMIGGTLLVAAGLAVVGTLFAPSGSVSPVSATDAATAASGSASEQAAALEAAELEARDNPPPPAPGVVAEPEPQAVQSSAPSGYQGTAPTPSIQFGGGGQSGDAEAPPPEPVTQEE